MKFLLMPVLLCCLSQIVWAQQDPLYAQYVSNPVVINPAYTGAQNNWQTAMGYRSQWGGFEGSPVTISFASHMSLAQNRVGLGLVVVQDKIGEIKNTSASFNYAYQIRNENHSLHFGLSTGFIRYSMNAGMLKLQDVTDPNFISGNEIHFNTGAGVIFKSERFIAGLSVPRLLPYKIKLGDNPVAVYKQHYYFYGAYVFYLNEKLRVKPGTLIKATQGAPVSVDFNLNLVMKEMYTLGLLTRNLETYGLLLQARFNNYRLGYVFEMPTNRSVGQQFSSHDIMLAVSLSVLQSHESSFSNF